MDPTIDELQAITGSGRWSRAPAARSRLQAARGDADRLQGYAARRPDVRVLRPPRELDAAAPCPLSSRGRGAEGLSTAGVTFSPRARRADHLPEDRNDKIVRVKGVSISVTTTAATVISRGGPLLRGSASPSANRAHGPRKRATNGGEDLPDEQGAPEALFPGCGNTNRLPPLQRRPRAFLRKFPDVPHLLPAPWPSRETSRGRQGELVGRQGEQPSGLTDPSRTC